MMTANQIYNIYPPPPEVSSSLSFVTEDTKTDIYDFFLYSMLNQVAKCLHENPGQFPFDSH